MIIQGMPRTNNVHICHIQLKNMQLISILYLVNYLFAKCSARKIAKLSFLIFMARFDTILGWKL